MSDDNYQKRIWGLDGSPHQIPPQSDGGLEALARSPSGSGLTRTMPLDFCARFLCVFKRLSHVPKEARPEVVGKSVT